MEVSIYIEEIDEKSQRVKMQGTEWELNIHMKNEELEKSTALRQTNWNDRTSIKSGSVAKSPVYWCFDNENHMVLVMVGYDDETWDFGVTIPEDIFIKALSAFIKVEN